MSNSRRQRQISILIMFMLGASGCAHAPLPTVASEKPAGPEYSFEGDLPFRPDRIWKIQITPKPYLLSDQKALVVKHFQYIARSAGERKRLDTEIAARGGDQRYLRWFESQLVPLGNWEVRDDAQVARFDDRTVVSFTSKAIKEVAKTEMLTISPLDLPDPLLRAVNDGCPSLSWDVISKEESLGIEVVLESHSENPKALRWQSYEENNPAFFLRSWSVGREKGIAYRTAIQFRTTVSRCPLPPKIHAAFARLMRAQPMGVDW